VIGPGVEEDFHANVTVRWKVKETEYSKKFNNWGTSTGRSSYDRIVARFPKGASAPILYDPANPARAYLDAGYKPGFFFAGAIAIFAGLTVAIVGYFVKP